MVIQPQDPVSASRAVINSNFSQLYNQVSGVSGVVASNPSQIIFNNSGTVGGSNDLTWDDTSKAGALGGTLSMAQPGPAWTTFSTLTTALLVNVGSYPANQVFGGNQLPQPNAIVGEINIPANVNTSTPHGAGLSGYALTSSTLTGAVGIYGQGGTKVDLGQVWGGNVGANNCDPISSNTGCVADSGHTGVEMYGFEINVGEEYGPGHTVPDNVVRALWIAGGSRVKGTGEHRAVDVESPGVFQVPKLTWDSAFYSEDGASIAALTAGAAATGNDTGSQSILLNGKTAGGLTVTSTLIEDAFGNLVLRPAAGAGNTGVALEGPSAAAELTAKDGLIAVSHALSLKPAGNTLATGQNDNVTIGAVSVFEIFGPSGAFSVTGFAGGTDGRILMVWNSSGQAMTLKNNSSGSSAANRIATNTGADVTLRAGNSAATFFYDASSGFWVLMSVN